MVLKKVYARNGQQVAVPERALNNPYLKGMFSATPPPKPAKADPKAAAAVKEQKNG